MKLLEDSPHSNPEILAASRRWFNDHQRLPQTAVNPSSLGTTRFEDEWLQIVSMGWTSLRLPESLGGLQSDLASQCSLIEAGGEALSPLPLLEHQLAVELLNASPASPIRDTALINSSKGQLAVGLKKISAETFSPLFPNDPNSAKFVLHGNIKINFDPAQIASLLLIAKIERPSLPPETALILLPKDLAIENYQNAQRRLDGRTITELMLEGKLVPESALIAHGPSAQKATKKAIDLVRLMLCAESCGIARRMLEMTIEHLQTRKQFGQSLSKFQVLQHRAADMLICATYARDMTWDTIIQVDSHETETPPHYSWPDNLHRAVLMTQLEVLRNVRFVAEQAIQLHGGMGVSDELPISHAFRRMVVLEKMLGSRSLLMRLLSA